MWVSWTFAIYTFPTALMCFHVPSIFSPSGCISHCIPVLKLECDCDEQASDSLQLSISESFLRSVCEKPNERVSGARHRMCDSMSVLQPSTLMRHCTEHKPGYLHAATQWTHTATAAPLHHMNVMTNVNGTSLYDFCVSAFCVGQECLL